LLLAICSRAPAGPGNLPPQIVQGDSASLTVAKDSVCPVFANRIRFDATDPDGNSNQLVWSVQTPPATGSLTFLTPNPRSNVTVCYQPNPGQIASDGFVIKVTDPGGAFDTISVNVTVINLPPDIAHGGVLTITVNEDSVCPGAANEFVLSATDPDGPSALLAWMIPVGPASGSASFVGGNVGGSVTICYAPAPDQETGASFVVRVIDDLGATDEITIMVNVTPSPDCPVISEGEATDIAVEEDSPCGSAGSTFLLNATDVDSPAGALTWSASTPTRGSASFPNGNFGAAVEVCYAPDPDETGLDSFQVFVSDGSCGAPDAILVNVTITPIADCPVIVEGESAALFVLEDSACASPANRITLHASDADSPAESLLWSSSAPLSGSVGFLTSATGGLVEVCYAPHANHNGIDAFSVFVTDGQCAVADSIQINVAIEPVNDCPAIEPAGPLVMNILRNSACSDSPNLLNLAAIDPDGGQESFLWSASPPARGVVSFPNGNTSGGVIACYTPNAGEIGQDSFDVFVTDGFCGASVMAQVTIQCGPSVAGDCNNNGVPDDCEADADGDGTIDACDGCPNDPLRLAPGPCGCGLPATLGCAEVCNQPGLTAPALVGCIQEAAFPEKRCDGSPAFRIFAGRVDESATAKIWRVRQDCTVQAYGPLLSRPESVLVDVNNYWRGGCATAHVVIVGAHDGAGLDHLYFLNLLSGTICEQYTDNTIGHVGQMALSSTGRLFIGSVASSTLSVLDKGVVAPFYTGAPAPRAVAVDAMDDVYVTSFGDGLMRRIAADGTIINPAFATGLQGAISQAIAPPGLLGGAMYVACGDRVMRVDMSTGATSTLFSGVGAYGAAFDPEGRLIISVPSENRLLRVGARPGDVNADGLVNEADLPLFVSALLGEEQAPPPWQADVNGDGCATGSDIQGFVSSMMGVLAP